MTGNHELSKSTPRMDGATSGIILPRASSLGSVVGGIPTHFRLDVREALRHISAPAAGASEAVLSKSNPEWSE